MGAKASSPSKEEARLAAAGGKNKRRQATAVTVAEANAAPNKSEVGMHANPVGATTAKGAATVAVEHLGAIILTEAGAILLTEAGAAAIGCFAYPGYYVYNEDTG